MKRLHLSPILAERKDLLFLQFSDKLSRECFLSDIRSVSSFQVWSPDGKQPIADENPFNILVLQAVGGEIPAEQIEAFRENADIVSASYLLEYQGCLSAVGSEFSVRLKAMSGYQGLEELAMKYGCEVYRREWFDSNTYFIRCPKTSGSGTLQLADAFYETGLFEFTSPSFFSFDALQSADTYFSDQWGLKNTGQNGMSGPDIQVEAAWDITQGSSDITVAVVDDGVELSHPDLSANLVPGYDAILSIPGGAPGSADCWHGTAVAGIIGAIKDNGVGISGVSPGCRIMPVRMMGSNLGNDITAAAAIEWAWANGADVINCSWGGVPSSLLTSAIFHATGQGRNGLGCVVVFSSGNTPGGDNNAVSYPGSLYDVMAVGAISFNGKRKNQTTPDGEIGAAIMEAHWT
jgi:subtilisin family serine protease